MSERSETCAGCYFWHPFFPKGDPGPVVEVLNKLRGGPGPGMGDCHRHAPTANGWYTTRGNEWCGDFQPLDNRNPKSEEA